MKSLLSISRHIVLAVTLLFSFYTLFSQKKEFTGYYINLQGDTVKGVFNDYKQWNNNPDKAGFILNDNGTQLELTPLTCRKFAVDNYDTYISYLGKRLTNPIEYGTATTSNTADVYDTITTFLRQIGESGHYKFYVYKDNLRINLYYSVADKAITELQQKGAIINNSFWESMTYKQQLKELFTSESDKEKIDRLSYTEESLTSLANKQNKGQGNFKKANTHFSGFVIMAGGSLNSLKFTGDKSVDYSNKDYPSNVVPLFGIGYMASINRNFDKFFLFPQLKIFSFKHSATTFYNINNAFPAMVNTFESSPAISFGFHFGYNIINKSNLKIFVAPGGGITMLSKNKQIDDRHFSATEEKTTIAPMPNTTYLLDVQAGFILNRKYIGWLSYNLPATITSYSSNRGNLSAIQFGIGYKL